MLIAIWDTTHLLIWAAESRDNPQPLPIDRVRTLLGDVAGDALLCASAAEATIQVDLVGLGLATVPALRLTPAEAVDLLSTLPASLPPTCGDSVLIWAKLSNLVLSLLSRQQYYPSVRRNENDYIATWQPLVGGRSEIERMERFADSMPGVCRALPALKEIHPLRLVETFLAETADALVRRAVASDSFFTRVHERPANIDVRWLSALLGGNRVVEGEFEELQQLYDDVHTWLTPMSEAGEQANLKLGFILREPEGESEIWPVEYRLVGPEDEPTILTASELWRGQASPLTALGRTIAERQEKFLNDLRRAMESFPSIERSLHQDRPSGIDLSPTEAFAFMRSWGHALEGAGFHVELPDWASPEESELSLRLSITPADFADPDDDVLDPGYGTDPSGQPITAGGRVGLESIVRFDWRIAIGKMGLTQQEFQDLVNKQSPLVRFRDRWVQIDLEAAQKAQATIEKNQTGRLTLGEAFRVAYGLAGDAGIPVAGMSGADWIEKLLDQAPDARLVEQAQPHQFKGDLRPYQLRGLQWLAYLDRLGLGACLADDMGLGKTIQFIALLLQEQNERPNCGPTLLFAPASVIGNWVRELERFAPQLRVLAHHGPERKHGEVFVEQVKNYDVVLTGYALAHRDQLDLQKVMWNRVALDEAQKVKNPAAAASAAIRSIPSRRRVAMTGTPIENHLSELWSIMEVLNPGLLGTPAQFRERFVIPVEKMNDHRRGQLLREMIRPFVLRRTKQDPEVAANLPAKMEMRVFTSLTPEQAAMYERITADMLASVENASGIRRRGLILAGLTRLKQVCDHPALLTDSKHIDNRSGKCERLVDMLEEVLGENEAALIFTQYREMGHLLEGLIRTRLNHEPLFLHGGVPVKERDRMIQQFQAVGNTQRIFILSLRAGGLGLNLTAANHVFHFDRWWNPAVEAQATDRAHRIGQVKIVQVHKFVSIGTVEERIDKLLTEKLALAENIVTSGDQWLTNLSTDDLRKYLSLSGEAMGEEA
ncbi:MAG TPA: DEAD/DEAH box helicase [Tepidisphaeraceae bacterium]|jgi:hypothetical protein